MKYDNFTRAVFRDRPNRFIAEVDIDGHKETVHVKNTGRCKELLIPGWHFSYKYSGFSAWKERTYANLAPRIEKMHIIFQDNEMKKR